jgi:hypothetical protein
MEKRRGEEIFSEKKTKEQERGKGRELMKKKEE